MTAFKLKFKKLKNRNQVENFCENMTIVHLNEENFEKEVLSSKKTFIIDFWAEWCGPCRIMSPIVEELAQEMDENKIKIGKMNVDENRQTPGKYGVMSIPNFLLIKNGMVVEQMVGAMTKSVMKEKLMKHLE